MARPVLYVLAIVALLAVGVRAEEPEGERRPTPVVLDVGEGVTCRVPGVREAVPLPPGKMVPTPLWVKLDDRLRVLEAETNRLRAERAETERQVAERIAQAVVMAFSVGVAAGAVGSWIVQKPPW